MDKKQVFIGVLSGVVCLFVGLLFGYIAVTDMMPGMRLSGADMDTLRMKLSDSGSIAARDQQDGRYSEQMAGLAVLEDILTEAQEHLDTLREYQFSGRTLSPEVSLVSFFEEHDIPFPSGDAQGNYNEQDWRDMTESLRDFIATRNNMSLMDIMRLQYELTQLNLQQELTTKTSDKTNQGVQTLFKNQ